MIKIKMKRYDRIVELKLPTEHEHVMVSLWKLGLERDPAKYTLRELNAVISYNTPWEHQMIRLVSIGDTLQEALMLLQRMMAPPDPIAARLRAGIVSGKYRSGIAFLTDLESLVENEADYNAITNHLDGEQLRILALTIQDILDAGWRKRENSCQFVDTDFPLSTKRQRLENVPKRYAIVRANRIMVDASDWLVVYVWHGASNSRKILDYALHRERMQSRY